MTFPEESKKKTLVNGTNGIVDPPTTAPTAPSTAAITTVPGAPVAATPPAIMQPVILAPNAPRTFLILQPQNQQQAKLGGFAPQGQRLLLAIQRPGGGVQHVAMPAGVVSISSNQLQTNGGVMTFTSSGGVTTVISTARDGATNNGVIIRLTLIILLIITRPRKFMVLKMAKYGLKNMLIWS